jgi:uncharacterized delta-60 repeat protein
VLAGGVSVYNYRWSGGYIARFNPDGTLDSSFRHEGGPSSPSERGGDYDIVRSLALQPDGKILVGGSFVSFNGAPRNQIARLNSDGTFDQTFDPNPGPTPNPGATLVIAIAVQENGQVLVGGQFTRFNGQRFDGLARLNASGSLDESFDPRGPGLDGGVVAVLPQPGGKVLIGGSFSQVGHVSQSGIARLNEDGTLDRTFDPGTGVQASPQLFHHFVKALTM